MRLAAALVALCLLDQAGPAEARPLRWARASDALTLDPHAINDGSTFALQNQIYEALVERDHEGRLRPGLATSWSVTDDPGVWEFRLRPGVVFHDGAAFDADDVVFSLDRARLEPTSDFRGLLGAVRAVTRVDDLTVRIATDGPQPLLPNNLVNVLMMDRGWAERTGSTKPQDLRNRGETFAVRHANGTGPFALVAREPDVRTTLRRHEAYWGRGSVPLEVSEIAYLPIKIEAARVAALVSGEVDFVQDVPVQDIERLQGTPGLRVVTGLENRTIFFGLNVGSADLAGDDVAGRNPFADPRVREALDLALDREAIRRTVMRGRSRPAGALAPPFIRGWSAELDAPTRADPERARALLAEAGLPQGFATVLHCSNDRFTSDEAICQAAAGLWARIGVRVSVVSQGKALHLPLIQREPPGADLYLFGWGVPTFDSAYVFSFLYHTRQGRLGGANATRFSDPEVDRLIQGLAGERDEGRRDARVAELWRRLKAERIYLPLHHEPLAYAMRADIDLTVDVANVLKLKTLRFAPGVAP